MNNYCFYEDFKIYDIYIYIYIVIVDIYIIYIIVDVYIIDTDIVDM